MAMISQLWWASVGGNKCEPVRVAEIDGVKKFYSIGCNDPHPMTGVELVEQIDDVPPRPKEQKKLDREWRQARKERPRLCYRRFE